MTKAELIRALSEANHITQKDATKHVRFVLAALQKALVEGDKVEFRNFGVFSVRTRRARKGRNPQNIAAGTFDIPERRVVKFRAGGRLSDALNVAIHA